MSTLETTTATDTDETVDGWERDPLAVWENRYAHRALLRLTAEIRAAEACGLAVPCQTVPGDLWTADGRGGRKQHAARLLCLRCPVFDACRTAAEAACPTYGTWAGRTYRPQDAAQRICPGCGREFRAAGGWGEKFRCPGCASNHHEGDE